MEDETLKIKLVKKLMDGTWFWYLIIGVFVFATGVTVYSLNGINNSLQAINQTIQLWNGQIDN